MRSESHQNQTHLLIIEDDRGCREFALSQAQYSIGRDRRCDIRLVSQFVSRHHATLIQRLNDDGTVFYHIVDGNLRGGRSANGLLVNGRRLRAHNLRDKDEVVFGPQVRVTYSLLKSDPNPTELPDDFDITLISPNRAGEPDEPDEFSSIPTFPLRKSTHRCNLIGQRRWFFRLKSHPRSLRSVDRNR